ncbi:MAG: TonB-dependent receptor [Gammaproteobacteria bacterium]
MHPQNQHDKRHSVLMLSIAAILTPASVFAQDDPQVQQPQLEEVVVTGVAREGVTKVEASVSVSSLGGEDVMALAPRSVAEVFRSLPGIRAESSGGNGNANITIRGIPLATGGSKFMQIHEDGLPVLEYGDMNFANTDNFIRFDQSVARIESIRGGSASTLASNSPGGIINMISKTGGNDEGTFGLSFGADYDEFRTDFAYGGRVNDSISYHIGGFFRDGEGVRETNFNGDNGGQIKANITKEMDDGFFRVYFKHLDDRVTTYLPSPVLVESNGSFGPVPGYDAATQALHSPETSNLTSFDQFGNPVGRSVQDGIESRVSAIGFEFDRDLSDTLRINNKFRTSSVEGGFISPFTDGFAGGTATIADKGMALCDGASAGGVSINCAGGVLATINGVAADPNQLAYTNLTFDTSFDDVGLMVNDFKITKEINGVSVTGGVYYSKQSIDIGWNSWHARTQTVSGGNSQNVQFVAVDAGIDADGNPVDVMLADNGAVSQSFLAWDWDLEYATFAPYLNIGWEVGDNWNFDVSVRQDNVEARGRRLDGCCGGNVSTDLNGNGSIGQIVVMPGATDADPGTIVRLDSDALLENTAGTSGGFISGGVRNLNENSANVVNVNYDADNTSFSAGGTYLFNDDQSVFVRYSDGGRAIADRLTQVAGSLTPSGGLSSTTDGFDNVTQLEIGYKHLGDNWSLFATYFNTQVQETNAEITSGLTFVRDYVAQGIEFNGDYSFSNGFHVGGNLTWADAEIDADALNASVVGNTPRRQADFIWTISPEYRTDRFAVGATLQGSTEFFVSDANSLKQDGYNLLNLHGTWYVTDQFAATFNVNNLTDEFVITESEEGSANPGDFIRARPLSGRSSSIGFVYDF